MLRCQHTMKGPSAQPHHARDLDAWDFHISMECCARKTKTWRSPITNRLDLRTVFLAPLALCRSLARLFPPPRVHVSWFRLWRWGSGPTDDLAEPEVALYFPILHTRRETPRHSQALTTYYEERTATRIDIIMMRSNTRYARLSRTISISAISDAHDPRSDKQVDRVAQRDANSCSSAFCAHCASRSAFPFHPELHLKTHTMTSGKDAIRAVELLSPPCGQLCCLVRCSKDETTRQLHSFRFESHTHSIWPSWAWHCCLPANREYYAYCFLLLGFLGFRYSETKKRKKRASTPPTYR